MLHQGWSWVRLVWLGGLRGGLQLDTTAALQKELFYPPLPLHHQGKWPHSEGGKKKKKAVVFLRKGFPGGSDGKRICLQYWRPLLTLQLPWKYLRDSRGPLATALCRHWGHLQSCEYDVIIRHPWRSLAYYQKRRTTSSCICAKMVYKHTQHLPSSPPLPPPWSYQA